MLSKSLAIIIFFVTIGCLQAQNDTAVVKTDTTKEVKVLRTRGDSPNPSGIFITPFLGGDFPLGSFRNNSNNTVTLGVKAEFASQKLFPFVFFVQYQSQKNQGSDLYKTTNFINSMETSIKSFGGGFYFLLNKYLKSNFTSPFFIGEVKFYNVTRTISPDKEYPGIVKSDSKVAIGAGLGITLYIFDIMATYNYVKEYSSLSIRAQVHIPLIRF